jgi:nucleoside-diphosphate-sugar epimerase
MTQKNIFLTGGTGSVGPYVLAELCRRGLSVTALVRNTKTILPGCRTVVGDLTKIAELHADIEAADGIVHLASPRSFQPDSVLAEDIVGTGSLLTYWRAGVFIYASSPTVVHGVKRGTLDEAAPTQLDNFYDVGKFVNEFQVRIEGHTPVDSRIAAVSLRPALIFTAGERRNQQQILSLFYKQCVQGGKFLFDSEEGLANYGSSYIGGADFGRAVTDGLAATVSGPYNVAGGFCTWRTLIETINQHMGTRGDVVVRAGAMPEGSEFRVWHSRTELDTRAFSAQTGFVPRQSLEELVHEFVTAERRCTAADLRATT